MARHGGRLHGLDLVRSVRFGSVEPLCARRGGSDGATVAEDGWRRASVLGLDDDAPVVDHAVSPDGRFVATIVDEHWDVEIPRWCVMDTESGALEWCDTATNATTRIPLSGLVDAIRTANPG